MGGINVKQFALHKSYCLLGVEFPAVQIERNTLLYSIKGQLKI